MQDKFFLAILQFLQFKYCKKIGINKSEWIPRKTIASMKNAAGCIMNMNQGSAGLSHYYVFNPQKQETVVKPLPAWPCFKLQ